MSPTVHPAHAAAVTGGSIWLRAARCALAALAMVLAGCASLPPQATRSAAPASTVLADIGTTGLAQIAATSTPPEQRELSGFRLLPDGAHALDARLALARRAQKSLDVQYYLLASDSAGLQFLRELRDAAARGVRVRLLLDDLYAARDEALLAGLAAQANVEVRLFNPLPARSGSPGARVMKSLHDFDRINRRMHNKLFIADGTFAVTGGRNVADEYFTRSAAANFFDMDVLSVGPVVADLGTLFDRFWNSEQAWPVQSLAPGVSAAQARGRFEAAVAAALPAEPVDTLDALGRRSVAAQLERGELELHFAPARLIADSPTKAAGRAAAQGQPSALDGSLALMQQARAEVLVASPYLVPRSRGLQLMQRAVERRVRLVVMTNSLAATDEPLVHSAYARYRRAMLRLGVELYELSPTLARQPAQHGEHGSSLGRLHAKLAVVDRRWLLIGSMNMDGRSAVANTELGLAIDSRALADEVAELLQKERLSSTFRLRLAADDERIEWVAGDTAQARVHRSEPDSGWVRRARLALVSMFIDEELL